MLIKKFNSLRFTYTFFFTLSFYKFIQFNISLNILILMGLLCIGIIIKLEDYANARSEESNIFRFIFSIFVFISFLLLSSILEIFEPLIWLTLIVCTILINYMYIKKIIYSCYILAFSLPIFYFFMPSISRILSIITVNSISLIYNCFGLFPRIYSEIIIAFDDKGVEVLPGCSGYEQIVFSIITLIILNNKYSLKIKKNFFSLIFIVTGISMSINIFRILLLSLIVFNYSDENIFFHLLHDSYGSLFFSFLSSYLTCLLYFKFYEKEIQIIN